MSVSPTMDTGAMRHPRFTIRMPLVIRHDAGVVLAQVLTNVTADLKAGAFGKNRGQLPAGLRILAPGLLRRFSGMTAANLGPPSLFRRH